MATKITIGRDTDGRDDYCEQCGYPFDPGDTAYGISEYGPIACSKRCAGMLVDTELRRTESTWIHNPAN